MRYPNRMSSIEALRPASYVDRRALYELVRDGLRESGTIEPRIASRLAVISVRHLAGHGGRVLLRGGPNTGKAELARTIATVLDLPMVEINAGMLAEMNWAGADLGFFLNQLYDDLYRQYPPAAVPTIAEHACVFVHGLDSVAVPGSYTSAEATRDYRAGKQQSLTALCTGASIPVSRAQGKGRVWRGGSALVIVAAQFDGLPTGRPDADDMVDWGLTPSLARALAAFSFHELPPLSPDRLEGVVRRDVRFLRERFWEFGFRLEVTDQAIRYVTDALTSGRNAGGPSAASRWIADAAEDALIRLLDEHAPVGARFILVRDDVTLPEPGRGFWRE